MKSTSLFAVGLILSASTAFAQAPAAGQKLGLAQSMNVYFPNSDITDPEPGGLHAVNPVTGERVWYAPPVAPTLCKGTPAQGCSGAQSAAATAIPGAIFSGANDGGMRAYSTSDGSILWTYDSNRDYETVNGVPAKGASIIGPGPVVVGGMLFFNSGYGQNRGRAGNVLLAFGLDQ